MLRGVILALLLTTSAANAQNFYTGNRIHKLCQSANPFEQGGATGYSIGAFDTVMFTLRTFPGSAKNLNVCPGKRLTVGQVKDVVCQYLEKNPQVRDDDAPGLVWVAMAEAWPCK